ncbi:MAG TPA: hypothetical protein VIM73_22835 [Polyangiaceae bacterium]
MEWEKPRVTVIEMNAEVGAYQGDFEDDPGRPDVVESAALEPLEFSSSTADPVPR